MATSKKYLKEMLYSHKGKGYSHMVVVCDSWDYTDFIVYIKDDENLEERLKKYRGLNTMYKIMEIYNYGMDLNYQLDEYRAFHESIGETTPKSSQYLLSLSQRLRG